MTNSTKTDLKASTVPFEVFRSKACYHGNERFNDHDKMVKLIVEADKEGMPVHVHSDFPVSPMMDIKLSIYTAEKRDYPKEVTGGITAPRNMKEAIIREQSLRAMTMNVARQFHQQMRAGTQNGVSPFGYLCNQTPFMNKKK